MRGANAARRAMADWSPASRMAYEAANEAYGAPDEMTANRRRPRRAGDALTPRAAGRDA